MYLFEVRVIFFNCFTFPVKSSTSDKISNVNTSDDCPSISSGVVICEFYDPVLPSLGLGFTISNLSMMLEVV